MNTTRYTTNDAEALVKNDIVRIGQGSTYWCIMRTEPFNGKMIIHRVTRGLDGTFAYSRAMAGAQMRREVEPERLTKISTLGGLAP